MARAKCIVIATSQMCAIFSCDEILELLKDLICIELHHLDPGQSATWLKTIPLLDDIH